jgi:heme-degrading monooxygenase HmoA
MIVELADIHIHPGQDADFVQAVQRQIVILTEHVQGFLGCQIYRGIESPDRYILHGLWNTLEDHTVGFRQSPLYAEWLAVVRPFAAAPAVVEHFEPVA